MIVLNSGSCICRSSFQSYAKKKKRDDKTDAPDDVVSVHQTTRRAFLCRCNLEASSSATYNTTLGMFGSVINLGSPFSVTVASLSPLYRDCGDCTYVYSHCGALFWHDERIKKTFKDKKIHYHCCCENGRVRLTAYEEPPGALKELLETHGFMDNVRAYNQMFSMTAGLRMFSKFRGRFTTGLVPYALNREHVHDSCSFTSTIRTVKLKTECPILVAGIQIASALSDYDVIIHPRSEYPKRVNKLHLSYMSLQFPLMFFFGEPGFYPNLKLVDAPGSTGSRVRKMSTNMFYCYQLHDRQNSYSLMMRLGRLFQQYVVMVYCKIARYLQPFPLLTASDSPDIVARVFRFRVKQFVAFLKDGKPLVLYTIEFQKRGLPHYHTLLWLYSSASSPISERIDDYISAELPDPRTDLAGYAVVSATMMHGPCGIPNLHAPCMEGPTCTKNFPKKYNDKTFFDADGRAYYRRRNTGVYTTRSRVHLDNSYVVPYNRLLCKTFQAHINVECCGSTTLIKYLFKYISKGTDRIAARISKPIGSNSRARPQVSQPVDEVQNFIDAQFICPYEACWRIFNFPIHHREPAVQILSVHLENMQLMKFRGKQPLQEIVENTEKKKTTLTEWICYNASSSAGRHLTYLDFPSEFAWYQAQKSWKRRANINKSSIGRMSYIHPLFGEAFFLRMLLCHQKGCTSFVDIRTMNQVEYQTYRSACEATRLLGYDKEWTIALEEASTSATASQLRSLFSHIVVYSEVSNLLALWEKHWEMMSDDIPLRAAASLKMANLHINRDDLHNYVLYEVEILLNQCGKTLSDFALPSLPDDLLLDLANRLIMEERNYDCESLNEELSHLESGMNVKQRRIYEMIRDSSSNNRT
ncbi:uncharacterized protein [Rutidosis leptorrhynchoides]|uniref:uncharacterized protein n=1 Tax=Rutidosis leptorrhynchoides TaxID=125765 RepID=UPI003A99DBB3